jgi:hypothetical protein
MDAHWASAEFQRAQTVHRRVLIRARTYDSPWLRRLEAATRAMNLRATTTDAGTSAELVADGKRVRPALVIAPSRRLQNKALDDLLRADMRHLEAVADGEISGACAFYSVTAANATDAGCAQAIGLTGKRAEIEKSIAAARIESYNGYTLARTILGGQPIGWVLDRGHFRFIQTNLAN